MHTIYIEPHVEISYQVRDTEVTEQMPSSFYAYVLDYKFHNNFKLFNNAPIRNTEIFNIYISTWLSPISESTRILLQKRVCYTIILPRLPHYLSYRIKAEQKIRQERLKLIKQKQF